MKLSAPFLVLLAALGAVEAASHDHQARMAKHNILARHASPLARRAKQGRCKPKPSSTIVSTPTSSQPAETPKVAPAALNNKVDNDNGGDNGGNNNDNNNNNNNGGDNGAGVSIHVSGVLDITDSQCGSSRATPEPSVLSGPNGHIDFLTCGLDGAGWTPPMIRMDQLVVKDLGEALNDANSPFHACSAFIDFFYQASGETGVPAIMLAAFAMQESTCNADTVGANGEQGLMQLTADKCGGAPGGNCKDPGYNIHTAARYFAGVVEQCGGNVLQAIGQYNGWFLRMTVGSVWSMKDQYGCYAMQNMDYSQQMLNWWIQNVNPYTANPAPGKYFNLNTCG